MDMLIKRFDKLEEKLDQVLNGQKLKSKGLRTENI